MVRRVSFLGGLLLGSGLCAFFLGAALIYLFTGQVVSIVSSSEGVRLKLNDLAFQEVARGEDVS
jgi:hypothetical protein